ncbi:hypothetical protein B0T25DRAFT_559807, partial [Lasiosphaeria hispida]
VADNDSFSDTVSATSDGLSFVSVTTNNSTTINPLFFTNNRLPGITDQARNACNAFLHIDVPTRISDMPTIKHNRKAYILEDWIHKRTPCLSWISTHGY